MKLSGVDTVDIAPGELIRWNLAPTAADCTADVNTSENEKFHLDATRRDGRAGWLALTIDLAENIAVDELTRAIRSMIDRHEVLRCHFDDGEQGWRRRRLAPDAFDAVPHIVTQTADLTEHVLAGIDATCSPLTVLGHFVAAVRRVSSTTVVLGFDHCFVDAYSLAVIAKDFVDDLRERAVEAPLSYLDVRRIEESSTPRVDSSDEHVRAWGEFLAANDWHVPAFPLDLGLGAGETAPVRTDVRTLVSGRETDRFDQAIHARGARIYPLLLTSLAQAVRDVGGPDELPTILPVHTRHAPGARRTVGWMVANVPIRLLGASALPGDDLTINSARLAAALPLAEIGLTPVYAAYADLIRPSRHDVFMISYLDYRRTDLPKCAVTQQISATRATDTAQLWFWRDHDGIHLRTRHPDTSTAARTIDDVLGALSDRLRELSADGQRVG